MLNLSGYNFILWQLSDLRRSRCWANRFSHHHSFRRSYFYQKSGRGLVFSCRDMEYRACLRYRHLYFNSSLKSLGRRHFTPAINPAPRIVGVGDAKSSTPIAPPQLPWYKQPRFLRNIVNILLLASFANSAAIILSYKSQIREISWQSKERIRTLKETIEKVRKGEPIDIRAALGTGDPEMEKRWKEGK